jgi:NAD(P)-dependent dehydrogenase (short-subunit alcohol dehydrogenase family)
MSGVDSKRRVLVTGAASGIGAQLVARLERQGVDVIKLDRDHLDNGIQCDLSVSSSIANAIQRISGPIDGIAHVAGVPGTAPSDVIAAVNVLAIRRLTDGLCAMLSNGSSIVVVSSVTAHRCDWTETRIDRLLAAPDGDMLAAISVMPGPDAYAASKRLANSWASAAAARLLARNIRVNTVSPGPIETPILKDFEESMGASRLRAAADLVGRHGEPGEVAAVIDFLLSPNASWVNGVNIPCDGGFTNARSVAAAKSIDSGAIEAFQAGTNTCN